MICSVVVYSDQSCCLFINLTPERSPMHHVNIRLLENLLRLHTRASLMEGYHLLVVYLVKSVLDEGPLFLDQLNREDLVHFKCSSKFAFQTIK